MNDIERAPPENVAYAAMEDASSASAPIQSAGAPQAALLIDVDNFCDFSALKSAYSQAKTHAGELNVCRAYGKVKNLDRLTLELRSINALPIENLPLDKNTTDSALIVDALALYFQQGVRFFVIGSGDADFAPLAKRLREWGCEVWCFSIRGCLFGRAHLYYDRVVHFDAVAALTPSNPSRKKPAHKAKVLKLSRAKPKPKKIQPKNIPLPDHLPKEIMQILAAVPKLRHSRQRLHDVAIALREKDIMPLRPTPFFRMFTTYFKLSPAKWPVWVELIGKSAPALNSPACNSPSCEDLVAD